MSKGNKDNLLNLTLTEEAILNCLVFRERYGLEIMKAISEASQGKKPLALVLYIPTYGN